MVGWFRQQWLVQISNKGFSRWFFGSGGQQPKFNIRLSQIDHEQLQSSMDPAVDGSKVDIGLRKARRW